jgi:hypothetical protein
VDDSVIGTGRAGERLARGARWARVASWQTVAEQVEAAGAGASALVLWQRQSGTGHAFGAHATSGGLRWSEISAEDGKQVLESAPTVEAARARYVVINPQGRVVDVGPSQAQESESTPRAIVEAPLRDEYGKMGGAFETSWKLGADYPLSAQGNADGLPALRLGGVPAGVGWAHARWALSWGLGFGSRVGSVYDTLLTAGRGRGAGRGC